MKKWLLMTALCLFAAGCSWFGSDSSTADAADANAETTEGSAAEGDTAEDTGDGN